VVLTQDVIILAWCQLLRGLVVEELVLVGGQQEVKVPSDAELVEYRHKRRGATFVSFEEHELVSFLYKAGDIVQLEIELRLVSSP